VCFFAAEDVFDSSRTEFDDWLILELNPRSESSQGLDQLPLFEAADAHSDDQQSIRRALKNWTSQLVSLGQYFGKHRQASLVFSIAAMQFRIHHELGLSPQVAFSELVHSMLRSLPRARGKP
jgi:hypothetical protein